MSHWYWWLLSHFQISLNGSCLSFLEDITFWLSLNLCCRVSLRKCGHCQKAIDKNSIYLVRWGREVMTCLPLANIFIDKTPCPCLSLVFVVGTNVGVFRVPSRLEVSVSFSGGTRFHIQIICICPAYPFCAPCFKLISATYWLMGFRPGFLYRYPMGALFPDCQVSLLDKSYLSNQTRPKRFLLKSSILYSDFYVSVATRVPPCGGSYEKKHIFLLSSR